MMDGRQENKQANKIKINIWLYMDCQLSNVFSLRTNCLIIVRRFLVCIKFYHVSCMTIKNPGLKMEIPPMLLLL